MYLVTYNPVDNNSVNHPIPLGIFTDISIIENEIQSYVISCMPCITFGEKSNWTLWKMADGSYFETIPLPTNTCQKVI